MAFAAKLINYPSYNSIKKPFESWPKEEDMDYDFQEIFNWLLDGPVTLIKSHVERETFPNARSNGSYTVVRAIVWHARLEISPWNNKKSINVGSTSSREMFLRTTRDDSCVAVISNRQSYVGSLSRAITVLIDRDYNFSLEEYFFLQQTPVSELLLQALLKNWIITCPLSQWEISFRDRSAVIAKRYYNNYPLFRGRAFPWIVESLLRFHSKRNIRCEIASNVCWVDVCMYIERYMYSSRSVPFGETRLYCLPPFSLTKLHGFRYC